MIRLSTAALAAVLAPTSALAQGEAYTFEERKPKTLLEKAGRDVKEADLDAQGDFVVEHSANRRYIITMDLRDTVDLLHRRADAIGNFDVPPHHGMPKMT